jgi:micrococcal nuclease
VPTETAVAPSTTRNTAPTASAPTGATTTPPASDSTPAPTHDEPGIVVPVVGVVDGDTLRVRVDGTTERLRLIGLDAPELADGDCLAQEAASRMQSLVQSRSVRIAADPTQDDRDAYGRLLRHVWTLDGRSVAGELIAAGLASEYTYAARYAGVDDYRAAQADAVASNLGIWGPACTQPAPAAPLAPSGQCLIKGNINNEGERIYHVPGQRYYDATRIDESRGERWFCTEAEARDAGWRQARV